MLNNVVYDTADTAPFTFSATNLTYSDCSIWYQSKRWYFNWTSQVASRKIAGDSVANAISKRDSKAIVATYRRLLAAKTAKTNAAKTRAKSAKSATTTPTETSPSDNQVTRESVIESLDTFTLVKILSARIAANVDELTPKQFEELADELAGISAMIES